MRLKRFISTSDGNQNHRFTLVILALLAAILLLFTLNPRDANFKTDIIREQRVDLQDRADEAGDNLEELVEDLDTDRTPAEKLGDAIEDTGEEIQDAAKKNAH